MLSLALLVEMEEVDLTLYGAIVLKSKHDTNGELPDVSTLMT